jgi:hypothetical protein
VKPDTPGDDNAQLRQTRIGRRLGIICTAAAAVLGMVAYRRGSVLGLHLDAAWRLPFALGLCGFMTYLTRRALETGVVVTRGGIVERTVRPRAFYLYVAFMAVLACATLVIAIALVYWNPTHSRVG